MKKFLYLKWEETECGIQMQYLLIKLEIALISIVI